MRTQTCGEEVNSRSGISRHGVRRGSIPDRQFGDEVKLTRIQEGQPEIRVDFMIPVFWPLPAVESLVVVEESRIRVELIEVVPCIVRRSVVKDVQFQAWVGMGQERLYGQRQVLPHLVHLHHDAFQALGRPGVLGFGVRRLKAYPKGLGGTPLGCVIGKLKLEWPTRLA